MFSVAALVLPRPFIPLVLGGALCGLVGIGRVVVVLVDVKARHRVPHAIPGRLRKCVLSRPCTTSLGLDTFAGGDGETKSAVPLFGGFVGGANIPRLGFLWGFVCRGWSWWAKWMLAAVRRRYGGGKLLEHDPR